MTIAEKLTTIFKNLTRIFNKGKEQSVYEWWDEYQNTNDYMYAFAGQNWTDDTYNPIRDIEATTRSTSIFAYSDITDTKVSVIIASNTSANKLKTFASASHLVTIRKFVVNELIDMSAQFGGCSKLLNLTIEGKIGTNANFQWSPLTLESAISVINALKNFNNPEDQSGMFTCTVQFADVTWGLLDADPHPSGDGTWRDYLAYIGWNT